MSTPEERRHSKKAELVAVGVITGAQGIRGQVRIRSFTDNPHDITSYGVLVNKDGTKRFDIRIDSESKHGLVASVKGVTDRNQAELMKGQQLFIDKSKLPEASDEEYYYSDLIGLPLKNAAGEMVGKITSMYNFGAGDVAEVHVASTGKRELFPFTKKSFPEIHLAQGYVLADLPDIVTPPKNEVEE